MHQSHSRFFKPNLLPLYTVLEGADTLSDDTTAQSTSEQP